jgi:hypothetical protein
MRQALQHVVASGVCFRTSARGVTNMDRCELPYGSIRDASHARSTGRRCAMGYCRARLTRPALPHRLLPTMIKRPDG